MGRKPRFPKAPDRGTAQTEWTTEQIGGEVVYGGGAVARGSHIVGNSVRGSVALVHASSRPGTKCRGEVDGNDQLQALGVFSSDTWGLYDLPNLTLAHAGRTDPVGPITLLAKSRKVKIPRGSGMLLRVNAIVP